MEIIKSIQQRYTEVSSNCGDLSCGSTMEHLNVQPGESILDLGCGRGQDTLIAASLTGIKGKAVGLDLTESMIEEAKKQAIKEGITNVDFIQGEIEALPFPDGFFHGVTSNCVINHARDKALVYREIYRVLLAGGRFVISDAVSKNPLPESVKNDPLAWAQCYGGAVTEQEYLDEIYNAGFSKIEIRNRREYLKEGYDFISLTISAVK